MHMSAASYVAVAQTKIYGKMISTQTLPCIDYKWHLTGQLSYLLPPTIACSFCTILTLAHLIIRISPQVHAFLHVIGALIESRALHVLQKCVIDT